MDSLFPEAAAQLQEVLRLFKSDFLAESFTALTKLGTTHVEAMLADDPAALETVNAITEVAALRADIELANQSLEWLADFTSWDLVREEGDIAIFTRAGGQHFYVRCEMLMQQPIFPLLAVFSEIDLLPTWCSLDRIKVMKTATAVAHPSVFRWVNWYGMNLPWPVSNRDLMLACVGIPMPQNNSVLIIMHDLRGKTEYMGIPLPEPIKGDVRMRMEFCCVNIMHKGYHETQISLILRSDPCISLLPQNVLNYCTRQAMFIFMQTIRTKCSEFAGSEYERRVQMNEQYYELIKERAMRYDFQAA